MTSRSSDISYFQRRAREETEAAERCDDERIRSIHAELARRYRAAASGGEIRVIAEDTKIGMIPAAPGEQPQIEA